MANGLKVLARIILIADHGGEEAESGGEAGGGAAGLDFADQGEAAGFFEFLLGERLFGKEAATFEDGFVSALGLGGIAVILDEEEAWLAGIPCMGGDGMDEVEPFAEALAEVGAVAGSDDGGEDIEGGRVGMAEGGNFKGDQTAGEGVGTVVNFGTLGELFGFGGYLDRGGGSSGAGGEDLIDGLEELVFVKITGDGEDQMGRLVAAGVVIGQLLAGDLFEEGPEANDGKAERMLAEGGSEEGSGEGAVGIIQSHIDFAEDDLAFALQFGFGEGSVKGEVGE